MSSLSLAVKAPVAALLLASILLGFVGRPARREHPVAACRLLGGASAAYLAALLALLDGEPMLAGLLSVGGVELACVSAWLGRGEPRDGPEGDGEPSPVGWDWDEFDRVRRAWEQQRSAR